MLALNRTIAAGAERPADRQNSKYALLSGEIQNACLTGLWLSLASILARARRTEHAPHPVKKPINTSKQTAKVRSWIKATTRTLLVWCHRYRGAHLTSCVPFLQATHSPLVPAFILCQTWCSSEQQSALHLRTPAQAAAKPSPGPPPVQVHAFMPTVSSFSALAGKQGQSTGASSTAQKKRPGAIICNQQDSTDRRLAPHTSGLPTS